MLPKGLLVVDPQGKEFLLVPEKGVATAGYTLSVLQRHQDQWVRLQPTSSRKLRETMLGALLEFFGSLCRILNHNSDRVDRIKRITSKNPRPTLRLNSNEASWPTSRQDSLKSIDHLEPS